MNRWLILIIAVLILASCQTTTIDKTTVQTNYRTGSEGVAMFFVQDQPPARVFDTEPINIQLQVENRGSSPVGGPGDRVYLSGFDANIVAGIQPAGQPIPQSTGKTSTFQQILPTYLIFTGTVLPRALTLERMLMPFLATSCYNYQTIAETPVCIDPDPFEIATKVKVCKPKGISLGTQGAPVAINSIDVDAGKGVTVFTINVANVGNGKPFRFGADYLSRCSPYIRPSLALNEIDYVQVADVQVGNVKIKPNCRPLDMDNLRLNNNRGSFVCTLNTQTFATNAVMTPMRVTLQYGYTISVIKNVEILKTPR